VPVGGRCDGGEMVLVFVRMLGEQAVLIGRHGVAGIGAGMIQRYRVKRGEHADVRDDGDVVGIVAIAHGGDVDGEGNVKIGAVLYDRFRIFRHAAVQQIVGVGIGRFDGVHRANANAAPAAGTAG